MYPVHGCWLAWGIKVLMPTWPNRHPWSNGHPASWKTEGTTRPRRPFPWLCFFCFFTPPFFTSLTSSTGSLRYYTSLYRFLPFLFILIISLNHHYVLSRHVVSLHFIRFKKAFFMWDRSCCCFFFFFFLVRFGSSLDSALLFGAVVNFVGFMFLVFNQNTVFFSESRCSVSVFWIPFLLSFWFSGFWWYDMMMKC